MSETRRSGKNKRPGLLARIGRAIKLSRPVPESSETVRVADRESPKPSRRAAPQRPADAKTRAPERRRARGAQRSRRASGEGRGTASTESSFDPSNGRVRRQRGEGEGRGGLRTEEVSGPRPGRSDARTRRERDPSGGRRRGRRGQGESPTEVRPTSPPTTAAAPLGDNPPRDMAWGDLKVSAPIAESLATMGYASPSEVQSQSIPPLQQGKDMVGQAVTGTGKTAAFGIPMCELIDTSSREVQGLVLVPTRELAMQVTREISRIGEARGIQVLAVYGGQPIARQIRVLEDGAPIVVGTPGRIKDHMNRRTLDLSTVKFAVLDEADEMLDIGFADDMEYILRFTPSSRQTALFSATIPRFLLRLINRYLNDPEWVRLVSEFAATDTVDEVDQYYFEVAERDKPDAVREVLGDMEDGPQVLIFRRMQVGVDRLEQDLKRAGYPARGIHGGLSQGERNSVMGSFRDGSLRILVATNVAARGLDIPTITHVINYDMPESAEEYVHRVGRTARMGNRGTAISFVGEWDLDNLDRVLTKVGHDKIARKMLAIYDYSP